MNKTKIGIFLSLLLLIGLTSCGEQKSNNKLVLNEILIDNQNNFQDDYGLHSAWIEIFNKSFGSADLAACLLKVSSQPGDTVTYFIPKGDILTLVKPRQHALHIVLACDDCRMAVNGGKPAALVVVYPPF
jgi:hypothetical protein